MSSRRSWVVDSAQVMCVVLLAVILVAVYLHAKDNQVGGTDESVAASGLEVELYDLTQGDIDGLDNLGAIRSLHLLYSEGINIDALVAKLCEMHSLESLVLIGLGIEDDHVLSIVESGVSPQHLNVSGNRLTDAGMAHLSRMSSIRSLFIGNSIVNREANIAITNDGVRRVLALDLEFLSVNGLRRIDDGLVGDLLLHPTCRKVDVYETAVSRSGVARLLRAEFVVDSDFGSDIEGSVD